VWDQTCADIAAMLCTCPGNGDFDGDGDVDLVDLGRFVDCISGLGGVPVPPAPISVQVCRNVFDFDGDDDVDLQDFAAFTRVFTTTP
jgi:hypothetical protein